MKLSTIKRTRQVARHGSRAWIVWRGARRLVPSTRRGHSTKTLVAVAGAAAAGGFVLAKLEGSLRHSHDHDHLHDHFDHDHDHASEAGDAGVGSPAAGDPAATVRAVTPLDRETTDDDVASRPDAAATSGG